MTSLRIHVRTESHCHGRPDTRLTEFHIRPRLPRGIGTVVSEAAVHEHLVGVRVNAERIGGPDDDIGALARFERSGLVGESQHAGRVARDPFNRLLGRDRDPCTPSGGHRLRRLDVQPLPGNVGIRVHRHANPRRVQIGRVFPDRIVGLAFVTPPVRPDGDADVIAQQQFRNLVPIGRVMKRGDPIPELACQVEHLRHVVRAIAVNVHADVAGQHARQRVQLQVLVWRFFGVAALVFLPALQVAACLLPGHALARDGAHAADRKPSTSRYA